MLCWITSWLYYWIICGIDLTFMTSLWNRLANIINLWIYLLQTNITFAMWNIFFYTCVLLEKCINKIKTPPSPLSAHYQKTRQNWREFIQYFPYTYYLVSSHQSTLPIIWYIRSTEIARSGIISALRALFVNKQHEQHRDGHHLGQEFRLNSTRTDRMDFSDRIPLTSDDLERCIELPPAMPRYRAIHRRVNVYLSRNKGFH